MDLNQSRARFGVAYVAAMHYLRTKDKEFFKAVLPDRDLITGVAEALLWAEDFLAMNTAVAAHAINELRTEVKADVMQEAAFGGIFVNMMIKRRG